ncbi:Small protein; cysteinyl-tRNA synthetase like-protein [Staphylococcus aureus]|uniref:Small protein cysteinyl-tRNA synthetase like-protein n=1 Tax=Staphylococcus aureus TaxID=1280 RepID=A0A380DLN1_STAAU|nr:Small protein; cysteinyl-tRNA synthetase like-protein [Staphylococcus aureus]
MEQEWFTDEEMDILKRGRNAKSHTKAKNTDVQTYRKSSAIEAVIGFLYLEKREERLEALLNKNNNNSKRKVVTMWKIRLLLVGMLLEKRLLLGIR